MNLGYITPTFIFTSEMLPPPDTQKAPEGYNTRLLAAFMVFCTTIFIFFHSMLLRVTKRLTYASSQHNEPMSQGVNFNTIVEECRVPSPTRAFTGVDLLSSVLKRLSEVEEKVNTLQAKPSQMPHEKEELLNAAVCRVDALEAELIATKKALHEALMRQEELLAYIDHQRETRVRKKFCW